MKYAFALISIMLGAAAQYLLKVGMSRLAADMPIAQKLLAAATVPQVWGGLLCYGLSMLFWLYVLSVMELSRAYPLVSLGYVFTILLGYYLLGESLNIYKLSAVLFIIIGVCLLMKS